MSNDRKTSEIQDHPDNRSETGRSTQKLKYPWAVIFIVANEFCERFSFYGIRTVLTLYLKNKLDYDEDMATVIYHVFTMFVYFFPLFGALLADSFLGKFRTIFYLSIIYAIGQLLLSLTAAPMLGLPGREFSIFGLLLIALGSGGIKPCVAAFGGDQFILPQQERLFSTFFSLFYFSINSGSLISSFLTPLLRSNVKCFGETSCYSLAFFVPAVLMASSIVIFVAGRSLYRRVEPKGNVVVSVSKCVSHAIYKKVKSKGEKRDHWLDYADDKYDRSLISDIKATMQVLKLFLPLPVFWALFDQQSSRWTLQATKMSGELGTYMIQPDQMQVINPLFVLAFIPLFEFCIYPVLAKVKINTPLKKLTVGGFLASLSFVVSALVELQLEKTMPILPSQGLAQVRVFNTMNCTIPMTIGEEEAILNGLNMWENVNIKAQGNITLKYTANFADCNTKGFTQFEEAVQRGELVGVEANAISWVITPNGLSNHYMDTIQKSKSGNPVIRELIHVVPAATERKISVKFMKEKERILQLDVHSNAFNESLELHEFIPDKYDIYIDDEKVQSGVHLKLGGVYTLIGYDMPSMSKKHELRTLTVTNPNSMHMLWLVPQYLLITMGEVMFSVTGLEFAFTQAPVTMKSLLQASWLLTVAFGNLIVVIVAKVSFFKRQALEYFLFAGLMFIDIIIFAIMATFYKYVEVPDDETITEDIHMDEKNGTVNASFKDDEK